MVSGIYPVTFCLIWIELYVNSVVFGEWPHSGWKVLGKPLRRLLVPDRLALERTGRALKPDRWALKPVGRASEPVGRPSEPAIRTLEPARRPQSQPGRSLNQQGGPQSQSKRPQNQLSGTKKKKKRIQWSISPYMWWYHRSSFPMEKKWHSNSPMGPLPEKVGKIAISIIIRRVSYVGLPWKQITSQWQKWSRKEGQEWFAKLANICW